MATNISPKLYKYFCENCNIKTNNKKDFNNHLLTRKHEITCNSQQFSINFPQISPNYCCDICNKTYESRSGLWRHHKFCKSQVLAESESAPTSASESASAPASVPALVPASAPASADVQVLSNLVFELMKTNTDIQKQLMEFCKNIQPTTINTMNSHNNNNNKTFNLHFFLNEQCKDAMNIMDFVNSVTLQLSDLESVGKLGYVEGISNIMIKKLNEMDIYKRPVHCSDAKRETLYVKDNNIWEKETASHSKLRKAIKYISKKNSDLLITWSNQHPASKNIHSKQNEEYMKMIHQAMGGTGEVEENENKIIKKISKMVLIEKNM
jgi:hypothetical protein